MDGSAVTTTSASRITMKDATEVSSRVSTPPEVPGPGCCPGCAVPGWVTRPGADIGPIPLIRPAWCRPPLVLTNGAGPYRHSVRTCYPGAGISASRWDRQHDL